MVSYLITLSIWSNISFGNPRLQSTYKQNPGLFSRMGAVTHTLTIERFGFGMVLFHRVECSVISQHSQLLQTLIPESYYSQSRSLGC